MLPGDALDALYEEVTAHTGGPLCDDVALILCEQTKAARPGAAARRFDGCVREPRTAAALVNNHRSEGGS